jgi:WD40 repeat protein
MSPSHYFPILCLLLLLAQQAPGQPSAKEGQPRTDRYGDPLPEGAIARLGTVRFRHGGQVNAIAYAPDGKTLASGGDDQVVRLWDAATGREVRQFRGHTYPILAVAFAPNGKTIASASAIHDNTIRLWDVATGREVWRVRDVPAYCLAFTPDGKALASGGEDGQLRLYDAGTGKEQARLRGHEGPIRSVTFSSDGKRLASAGTDRILRLWDRDVGKEIRQFRGHAGQVLNVTFSPDGKLLASAGEPPDVFLWEVESGKRLHRLPTGNEDVLTLAFASDGKSLASADRRRSLIRWDVATGKERLRLRGNSDWTLVAAFAPDGKTLTEAGHGGTIDVWDAATGRSLHPKLPETRPVRSLGFVGDGRLILEEARESRLVEWATGKELRTLGRGLLSPNRRLLASWDTEDGAISLTDTATGKVVRLPGHKGIVLTAVFSVDGKLLASQGVDRILRIWDVATANEVGRSELEVSGLSLFGVGAGGRTLLLGGGHETVHFREVATGKDLALFERESSLPSAFSPDGMIFAQVGYGPTASHPDTIFLRDVATGKELRELPWREVQGCSMSGGPLAFSPDGKMLTSLAGREDNVVRLLDVATGRERRRLEGHAGWVSEAVFSPDGKTLATRSHDRTVRLWEVATGRERQRLEGHRGLVNALAFSADGRLLATAGGDVTVLVWNATGGRPDGVARLSAEELQALWDDLAHADAGRAFRAIGTLTASPAQGVPLLQELLRPIVRPNPDQVARLVSDLDSATFAVREKAADELEKMEELAAPHLRKALASEPSAEVRRRAKEMLDRIEEEVFSPNALRGWRALEVLERIDVPEARRLLEELAKGAPEARLTRGAKETLERLARREAR